MFRFQGFGIMVCNLGFGVLGFDQGGGWLSRRRVGASGAYEHLKMLDSSCEG